MTDDLFIDRIIEHIEHRIIIDSMDHLFNLNHRSIDGMSPLTSVTSPVSAAAATIAGLISSVRPVGLPCRPLKLRFDDDAHTCRPSSLSGFMPRHMEQPAPLHSKPAVRKISSSPSRSAACFTDAEPGT